MENQIVEPSALRAPGAFGPKERGILFSAPMVRAVLEGRKTQTRRILKDCPRGVFNGLGKPISVDGEPHPKAGVFGSFWKETWDTERGLSEYHFLPCPYGQPGDRLWVRETWGALFTDRPGTPGGRKPQPGDDVRYFADPGAAYQWRDGSLPWRPSIHMPRWASRLTLEVTGIRVERLQDITEDDAIREGAHWTDFGRQCGHFGGWRDVGDCQSEFHPRRNGWTMEPPAPSPDYCHGTARMAFANLINKITGPECWDSNPWVWVVEFRKAERSDAPAESSEQGSPSNPPVTSDLTQPGEAP